MSLAGEMTDRDGRDDARSSRSSLSGPSRPTVTFATLPHSIALPLSTVSSSPSPRPSSSPSLPPSSSRPQSSARSRSSSLSIDSYRSPSVEHHLNTLRREFEQRFLVYQKRCAADPLTLELTACRAQVRALTEQLMVQELFMACQRVELAHFYTRPPTAALPPSTSSSSSTATITLGLGLLSRPDTSSEVSSPAPSHPLTSYSPTPTTPSAATTPAVPLTDLLSMTEALLAQTETQLTAERALTAELTDRIAELDALIAAHQARFVADTAELRAQVELRGRVIEQQEAALDRLTFENRALIDQLTQAREQLRGFGTGGGSSHQLPPATSLAAHGGVVDPPQHGMTGGGGVIGRVRTRPSKSRFVQASTSATPSIPPISPAALGLRQEWKTFRTAAHGADVGGGGEERKEQVIDEKPSPHPVLPSLLSPPSVALLTDGEVLISPIPSLPAPHLPPLVPPSAAALSPLPHPSAPPPAPQPPSLHVVTAQLSPPSLPPSPHQLHLHSAFHGGGGVGGREGPMPLHLHRPAAGFSGANGGKKVVMEAGALRVEGVPPDRLEWSAGGGRGQEVSGGEYRSEKRKEEEAGREAEVAVGEGDQGWS